MAFFIASEFGEACVGEDTLGAGLGVGLGEAEEVPTAPFELGRDVAAGVGFEAGLGVGLAAANPMGSTVRSMHAAATAANVRTGRADFTEGLLRRLLLRDSFNLCSRAVTCRLWDQEPHCLADIRRRPHTAPYVVGRTSESLPPVVHK